MELEKTFERLAIDQMEEPPSDLAIDQMELEEKPSPVQLDQDFLRFAQEASNQQPRQTPAPVEVDKDFRKFARAAGNPKYPPAPVQMDKDFSQFAREVNNPREKQVPVKRDGNFQGFLRQMNASSSIPCTKYTVVKMGEPIENRTPGVLLPPRPVEEHRKDYKFFSEQGKRIQTNTWNPNLRKAFTPITPRDIRPPDQTFKDLCRDASAWTASHQKGAEFIFETLRARGHLMPPGLEKCVVSEVDSHPFVVHASENGFVVREIHPETREVLYKWQHVERANRIGCDSMPFTILIQCDGDSKRTAMTFSVLLQSRLEILFAREEERLAALKQEEETKAGGEGEAVILPLDFSRRSNPEIPQTAAFNSEVDNRARLARTVATIHTGHKCWILGAILKMEEFLAYSFKEGEFEKVLEKAERVLVCDSLLTNEAISQVRLYTLEGVQEKVRLIIMEFRAKQHAKESRFATEHNRIIEQMKVFKVSSSVAMEQE